MDHDAADTGDPFVFIICGLSVQCQSCTVYVHGYHTCGAGMLLYWCDDFDCYKTKQKPVSCIMVVRTHYLCMRLYCMRSGDFIAAHGHDRGSSRNLALMRLKVITQNLFMLYWF